MVLLLEAPADVFAEREDTLVGDRVVGEVADLPPTDDAGVTEDAQVPRDVLLRRPDDLGELLHAGLAAHADAVEQLDARRVGERLEALGNQLDEVVG